MREWKRVYILGGGFAGIQAARAIARGAPDARAFLLDRNSYATMIPALPDVLSGRIPIEAFSTDLSEAVGPDVEVIADEVRAIDLVSRRIHGGTTEYEYDYLVIAHGSRPNYFGFTPDDGTVHTIHSLSSAMAFRAAVERHLAADPEAPILIVGAGYTGLEAASCLVLGARESHVHPLITVVDVAARPLSFLPERRRHRLLAYFERVGVEIRTETSLEQLANGTAFLSDGARLENPLVLWAAGMQTEPTEILGTVERARDGRIRTNEFLQLPAHPEVFAAGDAAALTGAAAGLTGAAAGQPQQPVLRRAVNFAFYSGRRAGRNVAARAGAEAGAEGGRAEPGANRGADSRGRRPARLRRFKPVDLGWVIPLGEKSVGRVFGAVPVGGRLGLRLHYFMSGFRHFGAGEAAELYKTAFRLSRRPAPPDVKPGRAAAPAGGPL